MADPTPQPKAGAEPERHAWARLEDQLGGYYLAEAGPYRDAAASDALLAERVEGLVTQEHAAWSSYQTEADRAVGRPSRA